MNYYLAVLFSLSVAIAAIIGWIRLQAIGSSYYPFLILLTIATLNEIISFLMVRSGESNAVNVNIYTLLEGLLIVYQFYCWKLFRSQILLAAVWAVLILTWITEVLIISGIDQFSSYHIIVSSLIFVVMSIRCVNQLLVQEHQKLLKHSIFLICFAFVILYTYSALIEIYWIWGLDRSRSFRLNIYRLFYYINLFSNLIYALAVLWIPKKREFISLY